MSRPTLARAGLLGAAFLFGLTFVVVKDALASVPPLRFLGWRFLVGGGLLAVLALPRGRALWRDGAAAGGLLLAGYVLQTTGLLSTTASASALISGLYVVFTPLLAAGLRRTAPSPWTAGGTTLAVIGLGLLTVGPDFDLRQGDLLTLGCALAFAGHIVFLSRTVHRHPVIPYTAVQLLVVAGGSLLASLPVDGVALPDRSSWASILFTGIGVSVVAFLLQVWAQAQVGPAHTAVLLGLEPVFGVLTAALVLGERLPTRGWIGAVLMVGAAQMVVRMTGDRPLIDAEAVRPGR